MFGFDPFHAETHTRTYKPVGGKKKESVSHVHVVLAKFTVIRAK